jgi:hypothetical protein
MIGQCVNKDSHDWREEARRQPMVPLGIAGVWVAKRFFACVLLL